MQCAEREESISRASTSASPGLVQKDTRLNMTHSCRLMGHQLTDKKAIIGQGDRVPLETSQLERRASYKNSGTFNKIIYIYI